MLSTGTETRFSSYSHIIKYLFDDQETIVGAGSLDVGGLYLYETDSQASAEKFIMKIRTLSTTPSRATESLLGRSMGPIRRKVPASQL